MDTVKIAINGQAIKSNIDLVVVRDVDKTTAFDFHLQ